MKYDLKQWTKRVSELYGSTPFMINELPDDLQLKQEMRQLRNAGYVRKVGRKWVKEQRHHANVWQVVL